MRSMYRRTERINEQDVPESQHTVFIRGLPGSITTSEIREFFEDSFGSCTFDFIKLSKDREKLHVAVRFVSKTAARECMEKYRDGELFGYPVQLTWFRDIRRYLNHLSKQGVYPPRRRLDEERRRGGFQERRNWGANRSKSRSRSRSASKSPVRRSRSPSNSHSRSHSVSSVHSSAERIDEPARQVSVSPEPTRKSKKAKKERRKKRRHSSSASRSHSPPNRDRSSERGDENYATHGTAAGDVASDMDTSDGELPSEHGGRFSTNNTHNQNIMPGSDAIISSKKMHIADLRSTTTASLLQNTSFTVDLESNNLPRQNIHYSQDDGENGQRKGGFLSSKEHDAEMSKIKLTHVKQELNKTMEQDQYRVVRQDNGVYEDGGMKRRHVIRNQTPPSPAIEPTSNGGAMTDFKSIQRSILQDVRYKPGDSPDKEKVGNFRLSSLSTHKSMEEIRREKMSRLSVELQQQVEKRKVQLELAYRHDCETFGLMTRKLISKDRTLEERLRLALLEIMKDLEAEALKNLDEYLDQMIFLSA